MNKPLVSVVMVVCNVDRFLAESIESILGQTFREFEFIIVDFGSTDQTKAIALGYAAEDSRIRLHEIPHCGLAEARNAGCFLAQGQYIAIMDADDVSLPNRLALQVEFMEKHPEVGLLGGAAQWIDVGGTPLGIHDFPTEDHEIKSALVIHSVFWQPTVLMRKAAFMRVGGYRAAFVFAQDYDLWLRIAEHFQCANLKEAVLNYRIHPYQVSQRKQRQQTLCKLAAQASASSRRNGNPDPLDSVREVTSETLLALGVTEARQLGDLASDSRRWIYALCVAGEYSAALTATTQWLRSDSEYAARWEVADIYLITARLYWKKKRLWRSLLAAGHAVMTRPMVLGRPLKPLLSWLQSRIAPRRLCGHNVAPTLE